MQMQANEQIRQIVGRNIRARRDELRLSRASVGAELRVDPGLIYKWERGQHRPTDENLSAIAAILGRDFAWFFVDHDDERAAA